MMKYIVSFDVQQDSRSFLEAAAGLAVLRMKAH
jgi:hypothetical protein